MNARAYVIAEAGVNHDGSIEDALRLIDAAADAGADCVKFQTFRAEALASARAEKAAYQLEQTDRAESQQEMLRRLELPFSRYRTLMARAAERKIDFLSTPFDPASLAFLLDDLGLRRIKIGSGDLTNAPLLLDVAIAGRDIVLSTGMATLHEVEDALSVLAFGYTRRREEPSRAAFAAAWKDPARKASLAGKVVLLHCTTEYPAPIQSANLKAMDTMARAFGLPIGYSDHTLGIDVAAAAVACGAVMIEKHLTLDRKRRGPDHAASLEPREFADMVAAIRRVEIGLGDGRKMPQAAEIANVSVARKALVAAQAIAAGEEFTMQNIAIKRPGNGRAPAMLWETIGQKALRAYQADEAIDP